MLSLYSVRRRTSIGPQYNACMRRSLRILRGAATTLCVALAIVWARSYFKADFIGYKSGFGPRQLYGAISSRGVLWIGWKQPCEDGEPEFYSRSDTASRWPLAESAWWPFSFDYYPRATKGEWSATLPYWSLALFLGIPAATKLFGRHRNRR